MYEKTEMQKVDRTVEASEKMMADLFNNFTIHEIGEIMKLLRKNVADQILTASESKRSEAKETEAIGIEYSLIAEKI